MRLPKILILTIPLAALAISGCGGGGDSTASVPVTTETTPPISKGELISKGDSICGEVNAAVGSVAGSESEVSNQVIQVSDLYINMVDSIKALGPPDEPAGYSEFIEAAETLSTVEGEAKLAAEREDTEALGEAATSAAPALEEFESAAGEYGFEECSEGPSAPTPSATGTEGGEESEEEEGGVEVAPEEVEEEVAPEEAAPEEEVAPETGGAGGGVEEITPEGGGTSSGGSGGVGPG
jgi:hypothetical protein